MSNAKRFLSVILAIVMVCSTLVVGVSAYSEYKGSAIKGQYNRLDVPVLTTDQYASAAVDELDRMLGAEQIKLEKSDLYGIGELDLTTVDKTMESVYNFVNGNLFKSFGPMLGDLSKLKAPSFQNTRRATSGDLAVLYAVLQFLYDNKGIFVSYIDQTINLGSILPAVVDLSEYTDVNMLLKKMLYGVVYPNNEVPKTVTESIDSMVQILINTLVGKEIPELAGHIDISSGTTYDLLDNALKVIYNSKLRAYLNNGPIKVSIKEALAKIEASGSPLPGYLSYINLDYQIPQFDFGNKSFFSQFNNLLGSIIGAVLSSDVYVWKTGTNDIFMDNLIGLAKAILINTGDDFFAKYVHVADKDTINAMSNEELIVYALRAVINGSVDGMWIKDDVTTLLDFGFEVLSQLMATSVPELDFSNYPHTRDTIIIMGVDYAIYSVNAEIDMGLNYAYSMADVDAQLKVASQYGIKNYGGVLNGISLSTNDDGWTTINKIAQAIFGMDILPTAAKNDIKTFLFDILVDNIINLDFGTLFGMLEKNAFSSTSGINKPAKTFVIGLVTRIVNIIFPGAMNTSASTFDAIATNAALANTVDKIFSTLYNCRVNLCEAILPVACSVLDLTSAQEFKFPTVTCDKFIYDNSGSPSFKISVRNSSTGINTGYTDRNGDFHQDSLYTYRINSVTSNIASLNTTNPGTIAGGETKEINVSGNFNGTSAFIVAINYDVLTEDGSELTDEPLVEYVYSYLSSVAKSDEKTKMNITSGSYYITAGPSYLYAKSVRDLYRAQYTFENASTSVKTVVPYANPTNTSNAAARLSTDYIQTKNTESKPLSLLASKDGNRGMLTTNIFETTATYDALDDAGKEAAWAALLAGGASSRIPGQYQYNVGATIGGTLVKGSEKIMLYNDYDLGSLLQSEINSHRQAFNYTTGWSNYVSAMQKAVEAVYSPFINTNFMTTKSKLYSAANDALRAAIEVLDANEASEGFTAIENIINSFSPSNEGIEYYEPNYNFFGVDDFQPYTYYNYRDEVKACNRMIDKATKPDLEGNVTIPSALTVAYRQHRLSLYGGRLLEKKADKSHLERILGSAIAMSEADKYSADSWADYVTAYNFAVSVNNEATSSLRQSKVNTAYEMVLEYQKRLMPAGGSTGDAEAAPKVEENVFPVAEGSVLAGIAGEQSVDAIADYFNLSGCTAEVYNEDGEEKVVTGSEIRIKDNSGKVIATYLVAISGDIDCDGIGGTSTDLSVIISIASQLITANGIINIAGDLDGDNICDSSDLTQYISTAGQIAVMDYANRTTVNV